MLWLEASGHLVLFECKFTEPGGGACSQPRPLSAGKYRGVRQCTGSYTSQRNPANGVTEACALSGKGIKYWEWVPAVLGYEADRVYSPCPFAGPDFQWMRNLVAAVAMAEDERRRPFFVLVHAGAPGSKSFPVAAEVASPRWREFVERSHRGLVGVRSASFSMLIEQATQAANGHDQETIRALRTWIEAKEVAAADRLSYGSHGGYANPRGPR